MDTWLVRPLFVAQTTWFGIPDFCNVEGEWVGHGVKGHEVRDGNGVLVGFGRRTGGRILAECKVIFYERVCARG